jgi:hypothetical protein
MSQKLIEHIPELGRLRGIKLASNCGLPDLLLFGR